MLGENSADQRKSCQEFLSIFKSFEVHFQKSPRLYRNYLLAAFVFYSALHCTKCIMATQSRQLNRFIQISLKLRI